MRNVGKIYQSKVNSAAALTPGAATVPQDSQATAKDLALYQQFSDLLSKAANKISSNALFSSELFDTESYKIQEVKKVELPTGLLDEVQPQNTMKRAELPEEVPAEVSSDELTNEQLECNSDICSKELIDEQEADIQTEEGDLKVVISEEDESTESVLENVILSAEDIVRQSAIIAPVKQNHKNEPEIQINDSEGEGEGEDPELLLEVGAVIESKVSTERVAVATNKLNQQHNEGNQKHFDLKANHVAESEMPAVSMTQTPDQSGAVTQEQLQQNSNEKIVENVAFKDALVSKREGEVQLKSVQINPVSQTEQVVRGGVERQAITEAIRQVFEASSTKIQTQQKVNTTATQNVSITTATKAVDSNKYNEERPKTLTRTQQINTLDRVKEALSEVAKSKDGKNLSFRLDPPSLGSVKVDISLRDGLLHARIVAESSPVQTLLRERVHELQGVLRSIGLNVDRVTVSVQSDGHKENRRDQQTNTQDRRAIFTESELDFALGLTQEFDIVNNEMRVKDHWIA